MKKYLVQFTIQTYVFAENENDAVDEAYNNVELQDASFETEQVEFDEEEYQEHLNDNK